MNKKVSFVIPCYGSELTISTVVDQIIEKMKERPELDYEIVAVNDCSPDNLLPVLERIASEYDFFKVIDLAKNVGKHGALLAGFGRVEGDYIVALDDDGQCPVESLWDLLRPLEEGHDMAIAKYFRKRERPIKRFGSRVNSLMSEKLLEKPKNVTFSNFIARQRFLCDAMVRYKNVYPYLEGLTLRLTRDMVMVPMKEHKRIAGRSGYTVWKSLKLLLNGLTSFSVAPLHLSFYAGVLCLITSLVFLIVGIARSGDNGVTMIMFVQFLLGGIILLALSVVGEYIGRGFIASNQYPQYVIRKTINLEKEEKGR